MSLVVQYQALSGVDRLKARLGSSVVVNLLESLCTGIHDPVNKANNKSVRLGRVEHERITRMPLI